MQNTFYTKDGILIGTASVPEGYTAEGEFYNSWQSEMQPFAAVMQSRNTDGTAAMCMTYKDIHYDLRNPLLRGIGLLVASHTEKGYDKVMTEEEYIQDWAQRRTGLSLSLTSSADTGNYDPSAIIQYEKTLYDTFLEIPSTVNDSSSGRRLYRFECEIGGIPAVVLAGMDWFTADLAYSFLGGIELPERVTKALETVKEKFGLDASSLKDTMADARETMKGMTFRDYMHGGLIGKMRRERKNKKETEMPVERVPAEKQTAGRRGDLTIFGSARRYLCICAKEDEKEMEAVFLEFIRTSLFDVSLNQRESDGINQKMAAIRQQAAMNQQIAARKQAELRAMQARTSQMISENSRQMSEGLMDSWKKKMASDNHISQGFSEAIRGVDTYQTSSGQNVEVGLAADHVYENQYGDVYGVSGTAPDQQTLTELNWQEINKKSD